MGFDKNLESRAGMADTLGLDCKIAAHMSTFELRAKYAAYVAKAKALREAEGTGVRVKVVLRSTQSAPIFQSSSVSGIVGLNGSQNSYLLPLVSEEQARATLVAKKKRTTEQGLNSQSTSRKRNTNFKSQDNIFGIESSDEDETIFDDKSRLNSATPSKNGREIVYAPRHNFTSATNPISETQDESVLTDKTCEEKDYTITQSQNANSCTCIIKQGNPRSTKTIKHRVILHATLMERLLSQIGRGKDYTDDCIYVALKNLFIRYKEVYDMITPELLGSMPFRSVKSALQTLSAKGILTLTRINMNGLKLSNQQSVDWSRLHLVFRNQLVLINGVPDFYIGTPLHAISCDFTDGCDEIYDGTERNIAYKFSEPVANAILFHPLQGYSIKINERYVREDYM